MTSMSVQDINPYSKRGTVAAVPHSFVRFALLTLHHCTIPTHHRPLLYVLYSYQPSRPRNVTSSSLHPSNPVTWPIRVQKTIKIFCISIRGSNPCEGGGGSGVFRPRPDRPWCLPTMGTGSLSGVKRLGRGVDHPLPFSAEVKEGVELYIYPYPYPWGLGDLF
jgi:hypothetical protein